MGTHPAYQIGDSVFHVQYGDITKSKAEVIVSSDDNYLTMGGGVSRAIEIAGGREISSHARKLVPLAKGEIAVTTAGKLPAKYIFHAATIDLDHGTYPDSQCIKTLVTKALDLTESLSVRSISFPALGTGVGGFSFFKAAEILVHTICDRLAAGIKLEEVNLLLMARAGIAEDDLAIFYQRAAALASVAGQSKRLANAVGRLQNVVNDVSPGLRPALESLLSEITAAATTLDGHPQTIADIDRLQQSSLAQRAGIRAIELSETLDGDGSRQDHQVERKAIQTRLEGLSTLLNVHYGSLNKLEIEKARYAGVGVPLILENQILEVEAEIKRIEQLTRMTRLKLKEL